MSSTQRSLRFSSASHYNLVQYCTKCHQTFCLCTSETVCADFCRHYTLICSSAHGIPNIKTTSQPFKQKLLVQNWCGGADCSLVQEPLLQKHSELLSATWNHQDLVRGPEGSRTSEMWDCSALCLALNQERRSWYQSYNEVTIKEMRLNITNEKFL